MKFAGPMVLGRLVALLLLLLAARAPAEAPLLYREPAFESAVRGGPDDLLLLAGSGLERDDIVVYRALPAGASSPRVPSEIPSSSDAELGLADVVSTADVPYSLVVRLPQVVRDGKVYSMWVRTARGEWSQPTLINDPRPLWFTPASIYSSEMPAKLPRELKIVGRNLRGVPGYRMQIRLVGPQRFTGPALGDIDGSDALNDHVARLRLPARLAAGHYRVELNRTGRWVAINGQTLEVARDPVRAREFSVSDSRFGGCLPDDGIDDTPCILRAIELARQSGGGIIHFGSGTWDLIDGTGTAAGEGIVVPKGVQLEGAGRDRTRIQRHAGWSPIDTPRAAFTLVGDSRVSGFTFHDLQIYQAKDRGAPFLRLGEDWQRSIQPVQRGRDRVSGVVIDRNTFDKPFIAIGAGGLPIDRLTIAYNTFGAYNSALELSGDPFNVAQEYRLDDSIIDRNDFKPGSKLDLIEKTGALAGEIGAGHRVDFSGNTADGASTEYLNSPDDAAGWRAAFFWNTNGNVEEVLVSQNAASCTGDKIGDGEAFAFDNNTNTFAFTSAATVTESATGSVTVSSSLITRQNNRDVSVPSYYVGHWVQIVSGPGIGEARKIVGYSNGSGAHSTSFRIVPDWDVLPTPGQSRIVVGREFWQLYVLDNQVDNRQPSCRKSNRSRRAAGAIVMWAPSVDSVIAGNRQYDSDGIHVQQAYVVAEHACSDCAMQSYFQSFLDIRSNLVSGEYDWSTDCSDSGIALGAGAAPWGHDDPPTVGFGVSISHNTIRHADAAQGGAIAQLSSWFAGPEPHRWPLSVDVIIHHNSIEDIDGAPAAPRCGRGTPRIGIAFPDADIAWHTVLYANSCRRVYRPVGAGGVDTVKVCPSPTTDSCECPAAKTPARER